MKHIHSIPALACLLISFALGSAAFAQGAEAPGGGACRADAAKLCSGLLPGKGLWRCMKEKRAELSPTCKKSLEKGKRQHAEIIEEACGDAIQEHCRVVEPGRGRIMRCLKKHEAALSESCKMVLPKRPGKGLI